MLCMYCGKEFEPGQDAKMIRRGMWTTNGGSAWVHLDDCWVGMKSLDARSGGRLHLPAIKNNYGD